MVYAEIPVLRQKLPTLKVVPTKDLANIYYVIVWHVLSLVQFLSYSEHIHVKQHLNIDLVSSWYSLMIC